MSRTLRNLVLTATFALLALASANFARASVGALDAIARAQLLPSVPALLGPVDESGRNGWDCRPERAASAKSAAAAELPRADQP